MAVPVEALVGGLTAGLVLLLLLGVVILVICKRKQFQRQYADLKPAVLQTRRSCVHRDIPFLLPPPYRGRYFGCVGGEEGEHLEGGLHRYCRSLSVGAFSALGSLRPDLYRVVEEPQEWAAPAGSAVRLWFSVIYHPEQEQLRVSLFRLANLPRRYQSGTALVKLQLLPEERRQRQAKAQPKGREMHFGDNFVFQVSNSRLPQCTLGFGVFCVDRLKKHQLIGRILFPLKESELRESLGKVLWRDLESNQSYSQLGDLCVSLSYSPSLQRLTVVVLRARGLQLQGDADVCVQAWLQIHTRVVTGKRTAALRGGADFAFNERLTFSLAADRLDVACVSLELLQPALEERQRLGLVVIGPFMYARGRELEHWNDMLSKPQELVKQWHGLAPPTSWDSPGQ